MTNHISFKAVVCAVAVTVIASTSADCLAAETAGGGTAAQATAKYWQDMVRIDLAGLPDIVNSQYIYALTLPADKWNPELQAALHQAEIDTAAVKDQAGYQAVLRRFAGAFHDAHVRATFPFELQSFRWPRFLVRYRGSSYVVVESETSKVAAGDAISSCDGKPIDQWVDEIAPFVGRVKGLESTRDAVAKVLFVDSGNPLYQRPSHCTIGNADVALQWSKLAGNRLTALNERHNLPRGGNAAAITNYGARESWVRIATMSPTGPREAGEYHDVIDHVAELRNKDIVVFDVRGNPGGSYNWFMAVLSAFYGQSYTDYYARARLNFHNVMMESGGRGQRGGADTEPRPDPLDSPPDPALDALTKTNSERSVAHGATVRVLGPEKLPVVTGTPPQNVVHAKVYVLTDNGCGSACIAFVDEMRKIPGTTQVGRDTFVDSWSGSPQEHALPSGLASISLPNMERDGRERGDNIPWIPQVKYDGDIVDTDAVRKWIEGLAAKRAS